MACAWNGVPASSNETMPLGAAAVRRGASKTRKMANRIRVPARNAQKRGLREVEGVFYQLTTLLHGFSPCKSIVSWYETPS